MIEQVKYQNQYADDSDSSDQKVRPGQKLNQGVWIQEEILKFMIFAHYNINVLKSRLQRRTNKIFKQMARFIGTRSSTQCRSQNQKLIKKHKNIKRIIKAYENQIGKKEFENSCLQYQQELRSMQIGRKKLKMMRTLQLVSVSTQTDFLSDSSPQENHNVKIQQQIHPQQNSVDKPFTSLPFFSLFGQGLLRNSTK